METARRNFKFELFFHVGPQQVMLLLIYLKNRKDEAEILEINANPKLIELYTLLKQWDIMIKDDLRNNMIKDDATIFTNHDIDYTVFCTNVILLFDDYYDDLIKMKSNTNKTQLFISRYIVDKFRTYLIVD